MKLKIQYTVVSQFASAKIIFSFIRISHAYCCNCPHMKVYMKYK